MRTLLIAQLAKDDLAAIWDYLAPISPDTALRLMQTFRDKFDLLLEHPLIGTPRDDLLLGLRMLVAGKYLVFYQPSDQFVEIVRVRHGTSDMRNLFDI